MRTLFDSVGGDKILPLLDRMAQLNEKEKEVVIEVFYKALEQVLSGMHRLMSAGEQQRKQLEDSLYREIVRAMNDASSDKDSPTRRLEVVSGGRRSETPSSGVLDFRKARKRKRSGHHRPVLN
ncbi:MAG: DotU family type IV/VI secretion system protein [Deltaproteobacteria bacterium]|nr:DotU family type IV/VI secretion system protein [Deltaproteobacteria bacterium]